MTHRISRFCPSPLATPLRIPLLATLAAALAGGCDKDQNQHKNGTPSAATPSEAQGNPAGELVVFAASSLSDAFADIGTAFEKEYPRVDVEFNFAGSQSLRTQIESGAQPQVFASADTNHMDALIQGRLVQDPKTFAHNELVIVVPVANPAGIASLQDLPKANRIVLAGENVPAGTYAEQMLAEATATLGADFVERVKQKVVSREAHVRQTLQKVVLGEADAAIVYATDAASAGDKVKTIEIAAHNVIASYPIAALIDVPRSHLGKLFVEFVLSESGQTLLRGYGFRTPGAAAHPEGK